MWYITRDQSHWDRATTILDAWGSNLTDIIGTDTSLLVALEGDLFVNAAEIMRWEGGWVEKGAKASGTSGFANQIYWLFARQSIIIGQANYGLASIKALLSFAVYLDDVAMVSKVDPSLALAVANSLVLFLSITMLLMHTSVTYVQECLGIGIWRPDRAPRLVEIKGTL